MKTFLIQFETDVEETALVNADSPEDAIIKALCYNADDGGDIVRLYDSLEKVSCREVQANNDGASVFNVVNTITYWNDMKERHPIQLRDLIKDYNRSLKVLNREEIYLFFCLKRELIKEGVIQSTGLEPRMKFETASEMYQFLMYDADLYSPSLETYIFGYNDRGSIAYYSITKEEAKNLAEQVEGTDECWSGCLGPGGWIVDPEGDEDPAPILEFLEDYLGADDWYDTRDYANVVEEEKTEEECKTSLYTVILYDLGGHILLKYISSYEKKVYDAFKDALTSAEVLKMADKIFSATAELDGKVIFSLPTKNAIREMLRNEYFANAFYGNDAYEVILFDLMGVDLQKSVFIASCGRDAIIKALESCSGVGLISNVDSVTVKNVQYGIPKKYKDRKEIAEEIKDGYISEELKKAFPLTKKTFEVTIIEKIEETVTVEAESKEEAEEIADNMVSNGDIILGDSIGSFSDLQYEVEEV